MNRVPLHNYNLTPLQEDLEVLGLAPKLSEAKKKEKSKHSKKGKDYMDDNYDYGDEYEAEESVESDENPVLEQAERLVRAFYDLSEDEIDELSDEQFQAIENAADLLGVDLTEVKRMSRSAIKQMMRNRDRAKTGAEKDELQADRLYRKRRKAQIRAQKKKYNARYKPRKNDEQGANESISNIIERLNTLTSAATEDQDDVEGLSDKIVEGLKSVFFSADELSNRCALGIAEDQADDDDVRHELGKLFHSIAEDAKNLLDRIFEHGDVRMEDAIEDLQSLASDLKRGLRRAARD